MCFPKFTLYRPFFLTVIVMIVLGRPMIGQRLIGTVPVGQDPYSIAVNSTTHKVYVANELSNSVTVIDEDDLSTVTVPVPGSPDYLAVDEVTNKVFVTGFVSMAVIDGATNLVTTINAGPDGPVAVNPATNKVYAINAGNSITVVDGNTLAATTVTVGSYPLNIAINSVTNKIYVTNNQSSSVTVIDGATNNTTTIAVPNCPASIAANANTNKTYVASSCGISTTVTVIDGTNFSTTTIDLGQSSIPYVQLGLDAVTNKIYVGINQGQYTNYVIVIDGSTLATSTIALGQREPISLAVEPVTNRIYISYSGGGENGLAVIDGATNLLAGVFTGSNTSVLATDSATNRVYVVNPSQQSVWVVAGFSSSQFVPMTPCRLVDTRPQNGGSGPIQGGTSQAFNLPQLARAAGCADLSSTAVYSLNVTAVPSTGYLAYLTLWPTGADQPPVSNLNSLDGRVKANAAIVPAGSEGAVSVYVTDTTNVIIDIDGYFTPPSGQTLQFYPLPPCRVADTRKSTFPQGLGMPHLSQGVARDFPVLNAASCNIPAVAQAYSLNFTAIPYPNLGYPLAYLEVWPTGEQPQHPVSTLNNATATYVANAAIVPAGSGAKITAFASDDTDLAIDIDGYFASPGAGGLSLYPAVPCRVIDTRKIGSGQPFSGTLNPPVDVADSPCGVPSNAKAYVFNATVVPSGNLSYLTLWPDSQGQPVVSTLNAADGWTTSNMAIVPSVNGKIDAYAAGLTQLILDISSYFAP